jgi:hypothetical protein
MTPIGQPCTCEPMTWLYFFFVQSVFVFVGRPSRSRNSSSNNSNGDPYPTRVVLCAYMIAAGAVQAERSTLTQSFEIAWFQPLNPEYDILVSSLCSQIQLVSTATSRRTPRLFSAQPPAGRVTSTTKRGSRARWTGTSSFRSGRRRNCGGPPQRSSPPSMTSSPPSQPAAPPHPGWGSAS